jgi:hypothetical protein
MFTGEWIILSMNGREKNLNFDSYSVDYVIFDFTIKRKTSYYVVTFLAPVVLTSYMNTLVFLMPADSGERVSYLVSIFVSNAVFVSFCTDQIPQGK